MGENNIPDALLALRHAISQSSAICLFQSAQDSDLEPAPFPIAHYISFDRPKTPVVALSTLTRFHSASCPVDLRSVYFAWLQKDLGATEYPAAVTQINSEIHSVGQDVRVTQLTLVERSDLRGWLQGDLVEIEQIHDFTPSGNSSGRIGVGFSDGGSVPGSSSKEFLKTVYAQERKMGDRNTVLRGSRPQDFEIVRRLADIHYKKVAPKANDPNGASLPTRGLPSPTSSSSKRRHDPIILLSPSQSSLLRLSNVRAFLGESHFEPPITSATGAPLAYMTREIKQLSNSHNPQGKYKFILTDSTEQFRPDYWDRVVAVFTTGQTWQFKTYKWIEPPQLFANVLGIFLGWRGEMLPATVQGWGSGVLRFEIDKYRDSMLNGVQDGGRLSQMTQAERYRDREVVDGIWQAIGESMRAKGWAR